MNIRDYQVTEVAVRSRTPYMSRATSSHCGKHFSASFCGEGCDVKSSGTLKCKDAEGERSCY